MKVEIPLSGAQATVAGREVSVTGPKGSVKRVFNHPFVTVKLEGDKVILSADKDRRKDKRIVNTFRAHLLNMVYGVKEGFTYKLIWVNTHFPLQVKVAGNEFSLENFFGEKSPRKAHLPDGVKVDINAKDKIITLTGVDIEKVGLAASTLEQLTRVTNHDRRVFQDGIYIVDKGVRKK